MAFGKHARKIQQKCVRPFGKCRSNADPSGGSLGLRGDCGVIPSRNAKRTSARGLSDLGAKDPCLCSWDREVFQEHLGSTTSKGLPK